MFLVINLKVFAALLVKDLIDGTNVEELSKITPRFFISLVFTKPVELML